MASNENASSDDLRRARAKNVADAVRNISLDGTIAWSALEGLSSRPIIDAIEVSEDEINFDEDSFEGLFNIYVTLHFGNEADEVTTSEVFPGHFSGKIIRGQPKIDRLEVSVRSLLAP